MELGFVDSGQLVDFRKTNKEKSNRRLTFYGRSPTTANKIFAQIPGSVSLLTSGFISYVCDGDTLQLVGLGIPLCSIAKPSDSDNCANPNVARSHSKGLISLVLPIKVL